MRCYLVSLTVRPYSDPYLLLVKVNFIFLVATLPDQFRMFETAKFERNCSTLTQASKAFKLTLLLSIWYLLAAGTSSTSVKNIFLFEVWILNVDEFMFWVNFQHFLSNCSKSIEYICFKNSNICYVKHFFSKIRWEFLKNVKLLLTIKCSLASVR